MNCKLCEQEIRNYQPGFHHLMIDETRSVDICSKCIDKFLHWRGSILSTLFPTSALKNRYKKKNKSTDK